jgi:hypothetical protein
MLTGAFLRSRHPIAEHNYGQEQISPLGYLWLSPSMVIDGKTSQPAAYLFQRKLLRHKSSKGLKQYSGVPIYLVEIKHCSFIYIERLYMPRFYDAYICHMHVQLFESYYNFCLAHSGLKGQTPAQAARLTFHQWSVREVLTFGASNISKIT